MEKKLEINQSNEWLVELSQVSFVGIPECDREGAAEYFTDELHTILEDAGFEVAQARGSRRSVHGWNGARFRHQFGPVGSFCELTPEEETTIANAITGAVAKMRDRWVSETVSLSNYVSTLNNGAINCRTQSGWATFSVCESVFAMSIMQAEGFVDDGGWVWDKKGSFDIGGDPLLAMEAYSNEESFG